MNRQIHISSLVVQVRPERVAAVAQALRGLAGLEVYAADPRGKLVLVLETAHERAILDTLERIQREPGVLSANLVYHHMESAESLAQEVSHGANPP